MEKLREIPSDAEFLKQAINKLPEAAIISESKILQDFKNLEYIEGKIKYNEYLNEINRYASEGLKVYSKFKFRILR